jgi:hypothetical protein
MKALHLNRTPPQPPHHPGANEDDPPRKLPLPRRTLHHRWPTQGYCELPLRNVPQATRVGISNQCPRRIQGLDHAIWRIADHVLPIVPRRVQGILFALWVESLHEIRCEA